MNFSPAAQAKRAEFERVINKAWDELASLCADKDVGPLVTWLLETEANYFTIFVDESAASSMLSLEGFVGVAHTLWHALVDDGDVCFPVVNGMPRIVFRNRHDIESPFEVMSPTEISIHKSMRERLGEREITLSFLSTPAEFIEAHQAAFEKDMRRWLHLDLRRSTTDREFEATVNHYKTCYPFTFKETMIPGVVRR